MRSGESIEPIDSFSSCLSGASGGAERKAEGLQLTREVPSGWRDGGVGGGGQKNMKYTYNNFEDIFMNYMHSCLIVIIKKLLTLLYISLI